MSLSSLAGAVLLAIALEHSALAAASFPKPSMSSAGYVFGFLALSALRGVLRIALLLDVWSVLPASVHRFLEPIGRYSQAFPHINALQEELAKIRLSSDARLKQCHVLESRLTQEQLRLVRANGEVKSLLRRQTDILDAVHKKPMASARSLQESLLAVHFLWRLSRALCEKLTRFTSTIAHLQISLRRSKDTCNSLRLDVNLRQTHSNTLSTDLSQAEAIQTELSKRIVVLQAQYSKSLECRRQAARTWITYRKATDELRTKTFRSFLMVITVLWHYTRYLRDNERDKHKALKADLAAARTLLRNSQSRYNSLLDDSQETCDNLKTLEATYQAKQTELIDLQFKYDCLQDAHNREKQDGEEARRMHSKACGERDALDAKLKTLAADHDRLLSSHATVVAFRDHLNARHDALTANYDRLSTEQAALAVKHSALENDHASLESNHESLRSRYASLESDLATAKNRCLELEAENAIDIRSSGLMIASLARHVSIQQSRHEQEVIHGFLPVYNAILDMRSRVGIMNDYVSRKVVQETDLDPFSSPAIQVIPEHASNALSAPTIIVDKLAFPPSLSSSSSSSISGFWSTPRSNRTTPFRLDVDVDMAPGRFASTRSEHQLSDLLSAAIRMPLSSEKLERRARTPSHPLVERLAYGQPAA
ncbi:hypothetical protein OF83DRAFT_1105049 [Amylostereum chailletii]|nr:hypothetical protein OF83DRAFT_1105049 [Amylostereum chailletii]